MKNIVFDWSGVIKDAFGSHLWVVNSMFKKYGVKELSAEELRDKWEEPYMNFWNKYLPTMTEEEELIAYRELVLNKDYPISDAFPGVVELIKKFKGNGDFVVVISSDLRESVLEEVKRYHLDNIFDEIITNVHKKTDALSELINKNKLNHDYTFIVGDSNNEIIAGRENSIKSIAVTWGFASEGKLLKYNPDYIVHSPMELSVILE